MEVTKRTINIEEYVTGGARCSNPKIVWDKPTCAGITCEENNGRIIKVAIPDDCEERCFWVTWTCQDYCVDCDPIRLKVCPCDTDSECEGCSYCDPIYGICVSRCEDDEFCTDHDTCVECDENNPCPNGKQCVGGRCECPPEKPYLNSNGDCAPCTDDSCPPGQVCTPRGCEDPVCESGVWHETKKKCVQCINTGDCEALGPNQCCDPVTNMCGCCPGFKRDPVTLQCVEAPCEEDSECPDCTYCKRGVGCVPITCPDGKICIPGEGCVWQCDCSNPNCTSQSAACVAYSSSVCYCKECSGSCANGQPCGEGCFCDDDLQCKPNPCANVTCSNGSECGKGCGCNQETHKCEPCSGAACGEECDNLLGCECPNGTSCQDVNGCDGPCDGYGGCPLGCTCVGGQCRSCSDFSCETDDCSDRPECRCNGTRCEGDPDFCQDVFETEDFNCGVTATLTMKDGCMCPGITVYATPHIISKGLIPAGSNEKNHLVSVALRLAKGAATSWEEIKTLHLLDETQYPDIADNDTPTSGTIDLTITEHYQLQAWVNGGWINQGGPVARVLPVSGSISFAGIARKENIKFNATKIGTGKNVISGVSQEKIIKYEIAVKAGSLKFPNNCTYGSETLPTIVLDGTVYKSVTDSLDALSGQFSYVDLFVNNPNGNYNLGGKFVSYEHVMSDSKRDPLFTWFRSEDNVYTQDDIIRKLYIAPDAPDVYIDTLYGPDTFLATKQNLVSPEGRVFGDMYYKVTNDCSCDEREIDFGNMKWCSPESLTLSNIVFSNCNKKVEIKSDIGTPCPVNKYLKEMNLHPDDKSGITSISTRHQARYHLMITLENGESVDLSYVWKEKGVPSPGLYNDSNVAIKNYVQNFTSPIVSLKLELRYGASTEVVCDWEKTIPAVSSKAPTYTTICEPGSNNIKYRFQLSQNHISTITAVGGTVVNGSGYKDIVATQGSPVTVYFTFTDYCPYQMELNEFCCSTLDVDMTVNQVPGSGSDIIAELTTAVTGGTLPYSVKYYRQLSGGATELVGESTNSTNSFKVLITNPDAGLYFASVNDGSGNCTKDSDVISIEPRNQSDYPITIVPVFSGCTYTGNVSISIPNQPDIIGAKIYYRYGTGSDQSFTITNQMVTNGYNLLPAVGQTVTLVKLEIPNQSGPATVFTLTGSATVPSNLNADIPVVTSFTINGSTSAVNICAGSEALIEIQGSANAIVQINDIPPISLDGSGYGSSAQTPITTATYTITGITNSSGGCAGTQGVGLTRQVQVTPMPTISIVSDLCDGSGDFRTVTFSNITSATDQLGNALTITGSSVTVPVATVTEIRATYVLGICTATYTHFVTVCGAPDITGDIGAPTKVCAGESATVTVSNVTGGTAPYAYNYYTNSDLNDIYTVGQTSKNFTFPATETVFVRVKDALGNISSIGSVTVQVAALPVPNIIAASDSARNVEVADNQFELTDDMITALFKTSLNYVSYSWLVTGSYTGTTSGTGPTFSLTVADITGTISLQVTVVSADGCVGTETVSITVVTADDILESDELLFTTSSFKLYKVSVSPSAVGVPELLCGAGNPATSVAMRGNGQLLSATGSNLYSIDVLGGCGNELIGTLSHGNSLGMLTADIVVSMSTNALSTYDLNTNTTNNSYYTISDGVNTYIPTGDLVRVGSTLYGLARQYVSGVGGNKVLVAFTINGSNAVTAFTNVGALPNQGGNPYGLAYVGGVTYLIFSDGKIYNLNTTTPGTSTLIGTIIVPMGEPIFDVTNNF